MQYWIVLFGLVYTTKANQLQNQNPFISNNFQPRSLFQNFKRQINANEANSNFGQHPQNFQIPNSLSSNNAFKQQDFGQGNRFAQNQNNGNNNFFPKEFQTPPPEPSNNGFKQLNKNEIGFRQTQFPNEVNINFNPKQKFNSALQDFRRTVPNFIDGSQGSPNQFTNFNEAQHQNTILPTANFQTPQSNFQLPSQNFGTTRFRDTNFVAPTQENSKENHGKVTIETIEHLLVPPPDLMGVETEDFFASFPVTQQPSESFQKRNGISNNLVEADDNLKFRERVKRPSLFAILDESLFPSPSETFAIQRSVEIPFEELLRQNRI